MADQLFLSYWLRGFTEQNMLRHWEKVLRLFPYSRLSKRPSMLRIYAIEYSEALLHEQAFTPAPAVDEVLAAAKEFQHFDCAYQLDTWWDLWQFEPDEQLGPAAISLHCFGRDFDSGGDEQLRVDCGLDVQFLPDQRDPANLHMIQANIRSVLKLAQDLDEALAAERRQLWTESGENFAEELQSALEADE